MKTRVITLPFDKEEVRLKKVKLLKNIVGEDNIYTDNLTGTIIPEVIIKCNKKQWKEIKFKLALCKVYY